MSRILFNDYLHTLYYNDAISIIYIHNNKFIMSSIQKKTTINPQNLSATSKTKDKNAPKKQISNVQSVNISLSTNIEKEIDKAPNVTSSVKDSNNSINISIGNVTPHFTRDENIAKSPFQGNVSQQHSLSFNTMSSVFNANNNSSKHHAGNVKVVCRFRPISDREREHNKNQCAEFIDDCQVAIKTSHDLNTYRFSFDRILSPKSSQQEVFEIAAKPIIDSVLEGFNGTIFAYGQTASGKTFTMMGELNSYLNQGIIPRMVNHVFNHISNSPSEYEYTVKVSMMEIYMERIRDLIETQRVNLNIREDKNKGNFVEDLSEHYVSSEEEVMDLVQIGANNRTTGFTHMNDYSSRSHTILMLMIKCTNVDDLTTKTGKLFLVDLAGSEKIAKTGATGLTLEEARNINKSLTTLGMVINSLTDEKSLHVPYRESKVTRILQESLGGNSKTCLIITCSPSSHNDSETLSTLRFGNRAKRIENKPKINKEVSAAELKIEVERLEGLLSDANSRISQLEKLLASNNIEIPRVESPAKKLRSPKKIERDSNSAQLQLNASIEEDGYINLLKDHKGDLSKNNAQIFSAKETNKVANSSKNLNLSENSENYLYQQSNSNMKLKSSNNKGFSSTGSNFNNRYSHDQIDQSYKANYFSKDEDENKLANLLSENRSMVKKLKEAEEVIKRYRVEEEEKKRVLSDLFELKYKFEEIERENVSKIEFLERKIKKLKFEQGEEESDVYNYSNEPIKYKLEEIVKIVSENNPSFEYNKREFIREGENLIESFKTKITIKSSKSFDGDEMFMSKSQLFLSSEDESKLKQIEEEYLKKYKEIASEKEKIVKLLKDKEEQMSYYEGQILDMKSKVDFYESTMSQDFKNYTKKIECLESSLNQVNKLYNQVLTQKSVLKIENEVLQKLVSKKNDTISKLDKEIDVFKDSNQVSIKIIFKFYQLDKPTYVKSHKKSINHNVVKVLKGGKGKFTY